MISIFLKYFFILINYIIIWYKIFMKYDWYNTIYYFCEIYTKINYLNTSYVLNLNNNKESLQKNETIKVCKLSVLNLSVY